MRHYKTMIGTVIVMLFALECVKLGFILPEVTASREESQENRKMLQQANVRLAKEMEKNRKNRKMIQQANVRIAMMYKKIREERQKGLAPCDLVGFEILEESCGRR